jgi:hypothetical protein
VPIRSRDRAERICSTAARKGMTGTLPLKAYAEAGADCSLAPSSRLCESILRIERIERIVKASREDLRHAHQRSARN